MHLKEVKAGLSAGYVCALIVTSLDTAASARAMLDICRRDYSGVFVLVRFPTGDCVARVVENLKDLEHWSAMWSRHRRSVEVMKKQRSQREETIAVLLRPHEIIDKKRDEVELCSATVSNILYRLSQVNG